MDISCIVVKDAIPGVTGVTFGRCTTLDEVLAAMAAAAAVDVRAVSGVYNATAETIVITMSSGATFSIPVALLLPVVADGDSIIGNGTTAAPLNGYKVVYDPLSDTLTITAPDGTVSAMLNCCPDATAVLAAAAFADPLAPTQAEAEAWAAANGPFGPGTLLIYPGGGSATDPDYVWQVDEAGAAINTESPIPIYQKLDYHPVLPIAAVASPGSAQPLVTNGLFEVEDTNEITLSFGVDGKLRAKRRLYASYMRFNGVSSPIAPSTRLTVPFNTMVFNHGGAGALGTVAHWTAPFACVVHVDALIFFSHQAWLTALGPGEAAGSNAAVTEIHKNGALWEQIGIDYNFKGGFAAPTVSAGPNEFKTPSGGALVECAAGDVLLIRAVNGKASGTNHTFFYAYADFHIVGAI